ncbi:MAG: FtsX-like permease family protein [Bacteroidetes bacterium]|nr:FtsX-like permease family protein [Bacteroidota bacterium]
MTKSIFLVVKANFRQRKIQQLLVGISIALSALLFASGIGILESIGQPFDKVFNKLKGSHIFLYFDERTEDYKKISSWFRQQPEVERVSEPSAYIMINGPLIFKGEKIDVMVQLTEYTKDHLQQDQVFVLNGAKKQYPGYGEIWLPNSLASNHNIHPGDTIGIPVGTGLQQMIVSATVVDPHYSSGVINPTRAWITEGSLPLFKPVLELNNDMLGIRIKDPSLIGAVWQRFNDQYHYTGSNLQYDLFRSSFLATYTVIGSVLLIFSVVGILVAMFLISTTISSNISSDYKLIGVMKAQGFTPANVIFIFVLQYFLLSLIFIPIGLLGSFLVIKVLFASLIKSIGITDLDFNLFAPFISASIVVLSVALFVSWYCGRKAAKIKPAKAIRDGGAEKKEVNKKPPYFPAKLSWPLPALLGIHFLLINRRRTWISFAGLLFAVFILVFSMNISNSFTKLKYNKAAWGFDNGNIQLSILKGRLLHEQFMESILQEKGIRSVMPYSFHGMTILSEKGKPVQEIYGKSFDGNIDSAGLINLVGRHPNAAHEISICIGTSEKYHKRPGDSITVFIEGQQETFFITGIYQDVSNLGQGFRLHASAIKNINPIYKPASYSLRVQPGIDVEEYKKYINHLFGGTINIESGIEDTIAVTSVVGSMRASLLLLAIFFVVVMVINIWNDMAMNIREYRKSFGIFKTLGFTSRQLRAVLVWKTLWLLIAALLIGLPIGVWLSPALMSMVTKNLGLVKFPYITDFPGTVLLIPIILFFGVMSAWFATRRTMLVNPRILIIE